MAHIPTGLVVKALVGHKTVGSPLLDLIGPFHERTDTVRRSIPQQYTLQKTFCPFKSDGICSTCPGTNPGAFGSPSVVEPVGERWGYPGRFRAVGSVDVHVSLCMLVIWNEGHSLTIGLGTGWASVGQRSENKGERVYGAH